MNDRRHIVQEYISSPLLVDHLKFDLRVYVVVTSIDPLEVNSMHAHHRQYVGFVRSEHAYRFGHFCLLYSVYTKSE